MKIKKTLVIGGNGGIGHLLVGKLQTATPGSVRAMARPGRISDALSATGAEIVETDLLDDLDAALESVDAVVFSAGSGGSTGADETLMVDLWGAVRVIKACEARGIRRFVMVSSIGADDPRRGPESLQPYLAAKGAADEVLMRSDLDWTVIRPGRLTDDDETGAVRLSADEAWPAVTRGDVAETLRGVLEADGWVHRLASVFGGSKGESDENIATSAIGEA